MLSRLRRLFRPAEPETRVEPVFDADVSARLRAEGKNLNALLAEAAEPAFLPPKPTLEGFAGQVRFELTLDARGAVKAVQMEGAPYAHVGELEAWAYAWTFRPAMLDGRPHACRMTYEVHWT